MSDLPPDLPETLQRRMLLRRGAAVAGAAAGAVALGVAGAAPAAAATGDPITQGGTFTGGSTTTIGGGSASTPALRLTNAAGPALQLTSVGEDYAGTLPTGGLLAIDDRILVGGTDSAGGYTTGLATVDDINLLSLPYAMTSTRLVDTRTAGGRDGILASGGGGLDASGKLKAGAYIDVAVDASDTEFTFDAAFLNLTSTGSTANGYLFAYPPGPRDPGSTTSYQKAVTTSSSCLAALAVVGDAFAVRIYSSALTHVIVDLTGVLVSAVPGPGAARAKKVTRRPAARQVKTWKPARRR